MELVTEKLEKNTVPEGYKRTEVGVIPEDWEIRTLDDICHDISDGTHYTPTYTEYGIPFYSVENVVANEYKNVKYISPQEHKKLIKRCHPEEGDILMTRIGTLGITKLIDWPINASIYVSLALLKLKKNVSPEYVNVYTQSKYFRKDVKSRALTNASPQKINMGEIGGVLLSFPPNLDEQQAIAEALSDVDALIAELDALIEKKQQIKKGAMQQLLTGKRRLPGFDGEWEEKTFEECFHFLKSGTNSRRDLSENGSVGYIHYGDIHAKWSDTLNCKTDNIPTINQDKVRHLPELEEGDLILADASEDYEGIGTGIEVKNLNGRRIVAGLHTILLRAKDGCIADGYKAYITSTLKVKKSLTEVATGTTVYGISKSKLKQVEILLPPSIEEQKAIARILSNMVAEIQALQAKQSKYEKIKQGMMQELLTGKTRLV